MITKNTKQKIQNFFEQLEENKLQFTFSNIEIEEIDLKNPFDSIQGLLEENGDFDIKIMYHHAALDYLKENDPSLQFSLEIAESMGFELKSLNSETLASLLASENAREEFGDLRNKIEEFSTKLQEQEEEEQPLFTENKVDFR
jgi:hypothetical protein